MKTVAVFGGTNGIGEELVRQLVMDQCRVHVYDRFVGKLAGVNYHRGDFGQDDRHEVDDTLRWDEVYITFGLPKGDLFDSTSIEEVHQIVTGNFTSVVEALKFARKTASFGCTYVLTSSVSAQRADPKGSIYAASKAAIEALARNLAREWVYTRVNVVAPGPTLTKQFKMNVSEPSQALEGNRAPNGRPVSPKQVALAMMGLARMEGVTGQVLNVDNGGVTASRRESLPSG